MGVNEDRLKRCKELIARLAFLNEEIGRMDQELFDRPLTVQQFTAMRTRYDNYKQERKAKILRLKEFYNILVPDQAESMEEE